MDFQMDIFPKRISCRRLVVKTWQNEAGFELAKPLRCAYHVWMMIGPDKMIRFVKDKDQVCEECDVCEIEECEYCFEAVCEHRGVRVFIRKCCVKESE
jgi:hypothetical protein